jgi:tripeptidyl-peptidase-1
MKSFTFLLIAIATLAVVNASSNLRVNIEPGTAFPKGTKSWQRRGPSKPSSMVNLIVMLQHTKEQTAKLEEIFYAVSDPKNKEYGNHLTQQQVTELMQHKDIDVVVNWLKENGAKRVDVGVHKDSVEADFTIKAAEQLLQTKFYAFQHKKHDVEIQRAIVDYTVPAHIANIIRIVGNVVRFPSINTARVVNMPAEAENKQENVGDWVQDCKGCGTSKVTPGVIRKRYSLPSEIFNGNASSSLAVAEFQGQSWDQGDLTKFASTCGLKNFTVDHPINAKQSASCKIPILGVQFCGEALLDIEYAKAIGGSIPLTNIYLAQFSLLNWAKQVEAMGDDVVPLVHSVSYGNDEAQQTGVPYMDSCNTEFQKIGVRGISILFASGDQGVLGREGGGAHFHPDFPGASPFITTVGGTDFAVASTIGDEKAWLDGGGGFSNTFGIPEYQRDAVENYIKNAQGLPAQTYWNATGRGYPDVAALAGEQNPYCIGVGSILQGIAGTSAASPTAAAIFALLNEERLSKGGKPLGFLNPWIYQNADAFNDVTQGSNSGGGPHGGFPAVKGWDASTGVGTPNYAKMVEKL